MNCLCINNSNRPNEIRLSNWLELHKEYTVVKLKVSKITGEQFFVLEEVSPDAPYGGYLISRFSFDLADLEALLADNKVEEFA